MCRGPLVRSTIRVYKRSVDDRLGVSFYSEEHPAARVRLVQPGGLAAQSGLKADDTLLAVNGASCATALDAARMLRDCSGDLCLSVERFLSCSVNDSDDESDSVLSPPRRFFSPPQSVREEVVDSVDRLSGVDSCDEAIGWE